MKLGSVLKARVHFPPTVLWAARVLLAAGCHAAARPATLQCEGPVSTPDSDCHVEEGPTSSREVDFQPQGYTFSKPFHLIVSYDWLILQGPAIPIFEGDPLVLRCQAWQDWPLTQVTFYRDGSALGPPGANREFSIAAVHKADSGHYHCSAIFQSPGPGSPEMASSMAVTVRELFPAPVLRATPSVVPRAGSVLTLSCQTKLPLHRSTARLLFSFYKDGRVMRGRGLSPELQVPMASEAHSGTYWCETATEDNQVWKQSSKLEVRVQDPSSPAILPTLNPPPPKSAAPGTPAVKPQGPLPPPSGPASEGPGLPSPVQAPNPHLHHQMGLLLKQMQDVRVLLGHLIMELRDLSGHLKLETRKAPAKRV
ncbi:Fc receptor-like A isoform X1 [Saccopteryx leptura]|uniref:Fc receptor-like A isoform X1 n=1 Tax=Saccopteryx leptura TaxID=249018 RepID=UPI00339D23D6